MPSTDQHESQWHHIEGRVAGMDAAGRRFVLRIRGGSGQVFVVTTDSATRFDDLDKDGLANAFSNIAVDQVLAVELELRNGRPLIAKEVRS